MKQRIGYAWSTPHRADRLATREAPGHNRRLHDIQASPVGANMLTRTLPSSLI